MSSEPVGPVDTKLRAYADLVGQRRVCSACEALENPANVDGGAFDSDQIGPWTRLHGDLDAGLMVVGQDWGDVEYLRRNRGLDDLGNPTMRTLGELLSSIGWDVPLDRYGAGARGLFLTNAILCMKVAGGLQGEVQPAWFTNCGKRFLRRQVEIVAPRVVVPLGSRAYAALCGAFGLRPLSPFLRAVQGPAVTLLPGTTMVPVYHCGNRVLNTHRSKAQQVLDWGRVGLALLEGG